MEQMEVKNKTNNCDNCPFKSRTSQPRGQVSSKLVIVGESPGQLEIARNSTFIGNSGKLLDDTLKKAGIQIEPYYTNAFKCLPKQGKTDAELNNACRACSHRLLKEILEHERTLIIALGNAAARSLLNSYNFTISKHRGNLIKTNIASIGILVTYHPAHILRNQQLYPQFEADLKTAAQLLTNTVTDRGRHKRITLTNDNIDDAIKHINSHQMVAADIETTGTNYHKDKFILGTVSTPTITYIYHNLKLFQQILDNTATKWVWHNGKFDYKFLTQNGVTGIKLDHDTMLMSYALDETPGRHSLDACINDHLAIDTHKSMLDDYTKLGSVIIQKYKRKHKKDRNETLLNTAIAETTSIEGVTPTMCDLWVSTGANKKSYSLVPTAILADYAALDTERTLQLAELLLPRVNADVNLKKLYSTILSKASIPLAHIELEGMPISRQQLNIADKSIISDIDALTSKLRRLSGDDSLNPNSSPQILQVLNNKFGLNVQSTNFETISKHTDVEFVRVLLEYRTSTKLYNTYIKMFKRQIGNPDDRIRTTYLLHGTVTGRLSSTRPNLQNIPKDKTIRSIFRTPPSRVFMSFDYSQAELRSLAALSGDTEMSDIFNTGKDLHTEVAIQIFGDEYTSLNTDDHNQKHKKSILRRYAKTVNFGVIYGITAQRLAIRLDIDTKFAQRLIDGFMERFPRAAAYMMDTRDLSKSHERLVTPFGRRRRFHVITNANRHSLENEAGNFNHQSMCSDFTLLSAIQLSERLPNLSGNPRQVNIIHDDNMFEIDDDDDAKRTLYETAKGVMESVPLAAGITSVPFTIDAEVGNDWAEMQPYIYNTGH